MSVEQVRIPSREQLMAQCKQLADGRALSANQFANFVESFCLLCGEKPSEDPHTIFTEMEYELVETKGDVVTIRWVRALGEVKASISFTKDQSGFKVKEKIDIFLEDMRGFHSVRFPSLVLEDTKTLAMPLYFNPYMGGTCSELGIVCHKVWDIYCSS